jgi:hypothetical protein
VLGVAYAENRVFVVMLSVSMLILTVMAPYKILLTSLEENFDL